jgi:uncharacterized protein (DUF488 family)
MSTVFTIGHSTRTTGEFLALLHQVAIDHLVDVRALPRSRSSPQFDSGCLKHTLCLGRIEYRHIAGLGDWPCERAEKAGETVRVWSDVSLHSYAAYAETSAFVSGINQLRDLAADCCCAIMSEEALWWRCHRRVIADYLLVGGMRVGHILGLDKIELATLTPGIQLLPGGRLRYPEMDGCISAKE